ncbi:MULTISPECIES: N-acetylmannosamine-6-phosphate 2-epimerase [Aerococcus]|uniref:Putative N-acetylmannosamine-6-phosphate 2-epimerase n=1 Tax=Aerococcus sanguinicola TaxID=119206 RepID=A0A5N1GIA5_9LACT|nr:MULTISPECIES: N-acetylmannosamine-6-phosphate 2-epimerase [Aerococcus]KAA9300144.1 N-acetylmannosamine-6-phosphate 2-epimerase [Aerococcus sanguinicola]MDK6369486.1 N-acetylmannosamine-6-phosphate 2-epimerase [Aerococcus sp. UMB9870]MDK6679973.1 N-acetylmannosamine-6-phosphate 2-epimerase [Aerococcus sp. UMB8608]MDK6686145.1 N-acetylmannosamine-6-phosphate 2-epimerase [Aerococcus sp. UMB8623]MDK6939925.1 N-acetylmannosamine-6-phosphate 2-epimerase [Aerococcus sp. UMB8487]
MLESAKGELIVSCQALEDEPLHSSYIMSRMAVAAQEGGAKGIRSNSVADIEAIKEVVDLPIIGIIKQDYPDAEIYITPTMKEIEALVATGVEVIALDATVSKRPNNQKLEDFVKEIKAKYPDQALMADCSTLDEMLAADRLGFDYIGTTMVGYTEQSKELKIEANDFELIRQALDQIDRPIIAEGNIDTPDKARRVLDLGVYSVVVGSAITRPQLITEKFVAKIHQ